MESTLTPTVGTDLLDYAPGSTATITAENFIIGSTLEFQVLHVTDPGDDGVYGTLDDLLGDNSGAGHETWIITDGVRTAGADGVLGTADDGGDLDGVADGNITTTWYVNPDDSLGATFLLTAIGDGGETATTSFTDADGGTNKVYQHWEDADGGAWQNNILSDNKSNYFEGEVIPHVFVYKASNNEPLVNGQSYSFNITYNYYQQNTNAGGFDYITSFNVSRTPGPNDATNPYIAPTEDGTFVNGGGTQGSFFTVDANITNVSDVTYLGTGSKDGYVTVTFTYTGTTTTNGIAEIYYGLHIAQPGAVPDQGAGETKGASAWTGGSLQTTVDIGGSGATSIQLSPAAVIDGEINGIKFHDLGNDGIRNGEDPVLEGWTIFLDTNNNDVLDAGEAFDVTDVNGFYSFSVTPDADKSDMDNDPYIVREVQQEGWVQTTLDPAPILITASDPREEFVNFGNYELPVEPQLTISGFKWNDANNNGLWDLDEVGLEDWQIFVDADGDDVLDLGEEFTTTLADGSYSFADLTLDLNQTYTIREVLKAGWVQNYDGSVTITVDGDGNVTTDPAGVLSLQGEVLVGEGSLFGTEPLNFGNLLPNPVIQIVKTGTFDAGADGFADPGELITYAFAVTNEGNVSLSNVTATDPLVGTLTFEGGDTDGDTELDVNETWNYSATYAVTQDDIDAGFVYNLATADSEESEQDTDDHNEPLPQNPALAVSKSPDKPAVDAAGQIIAYTILVENTGNVTLTNVVVNDPMLLDLAYFSGDDGNNKLDVDEIWTYTGTYAVQQSDIADNIAALDFGAQAVHPDFGQTWDGELASISLDGPIGDGDIDN
ncbi:MAG TPA: hypothetical protein VJ789_06295, partial [Burkholderiales bacterium]|nr:hypothetical protein [Burkholderiales bacterium]